MKGHGAACKHSLVQACQRSAEARLYDDQPISLESFDEHVGVAFAFVLRRAHAFSMKYPGIRIFFYPLRHK